MKLSEAYQVLELSPNVSLDDAKKQYKLLAKKWHPDINKEPGAEAKFKSINEAFQCIQNGQGNEQESFSGFGNPFGRSSNIVQLNNVEIHITIDFKESVLGCKKEVKYSRKSKCTSCEGNGEITLNNGCKKCDGSGRKIIKQSGSVFISTCSDCRGRNNVTGCTVCNGEGSIFTDVSVHVSVPAGILNNNILRLQGMGHYAGTFMGFADQNTDVFCHVSVTPDPNLSLNGKDVISNLNISLLQALIGGNHTVKTINGDREISVKPQSKNKEEVILPNLGVGYSGSQRVILNISYPTNIDKLINVLQEVE